jgi:hypothetical protein
MHGYTQQQIMASLRNEPIAHANVLQKCVKLTRTSHGAVTRTAAVSRQSSPTGSACLAAVAAAAAAAAATALAAVPGGGGGGGGGGSTRADRREGAAAWAAMLNGTSTCRSMPVAACRSSSGACGERESDM